MLKNNDTNSSFPDSSNKDIEVQSNLCRYDQLVNHADSPPDEWSKSCVSTECSMHQLSPYIGKLKSSIARDLIWDYSNKGDLIVEPFSGAGTVPLEAILLNRRVFAADISPYSKILTKAKLSPPPSLAAALRQLERVSKKAEYLPEPDLRSVPKWVRSFYHPKTLKEIIKFLSVCRRTRHDFLIACLLGILHHQRPGFLSFPSSHLVPYLRNKKYPPSEYPEMYEYREIYPRMSAKIERAYKRIPARLPDANWTFRLSSIENLTFPPSFDCLITSPPYMNALDYGRDNRLRLWFLNPNGSRTVDNPATRSKEAFQYAIKAMAIKVENNLNKAGHCILIVGERLARRRLEYLSEIICRIMAERAPSLNLISIIKDDIPDIRRSRKNCKATKTEHILIYKKKR